MRVLWAYGQNRELYSLSKPAVFAGKSEPANNKIWYQFPIIQTKFAVWRPVPLIEGLGEHSIIYLRNIYSCISIVLYDVKLEILLALLRLYDMLQKFHSGLQDLLEHMHLRPFAKCVYI